MNSIVDYFNNNNYVHLPDFLDKENCAQLVTELQKLVDAGKTTKDPQCPLSQAIHGAPVFDSLLEQLTPHFEQASGKRLLPTYSYARLYTPGDELKIHTDRPSCEISATLTLGFEGDPWPIYVGDYAKIGAGREVTTQEDSVSYLTNEREIKMNVGDAVLYRGMDKVHWREPYKEGKWQAQVFLHYVDANGPHSEWKYDKRSELSHHKKNIDQTTHNDNNIDQILYWCFDDALNPDACEKIIESIELQTDGEYAGIGISREKIIDKNIRDVKHVNLFTHRGIGATMAGMGLYANRQAWNFNITHSNQTDYLKYSFDGHYSAHVDTFLAPKQKDCRKLTVLVFLNDDFEGGRFFLQNSDQKIYPPQSPGSCLVFPSFVLHGVEPVTKGIRRSIVTWMIGPWFN